jgi:hypothetical protein
VIYNFRPISPEKKRSGDYPNFISPRGATVPQDDVSPALSLLGGLLAEPTSPVNFLQSMRQLPRLRPARFHKKIQHLQQRPQALRFAPSAPWFEQIPVIRQHRLDQFHNFAHRQRFVLKTTFELLRIDCAASRNISTDAQAKR